MNIFWGGGYLTQITLFGAAFHV